MNEYMDLNRADMQEILEHNIEMTASKSLGSTRSNQEQQPQSGSPEFVIDNTIGQLNIIQEDSARSAMLNQNVQEYNSAETKNQDLDVSEVTDSNVKSVLPPKLEEEKKPSYSIVKTAVVPKHQ